MDQNIRIILEINKLKRIPSKFQWKNEWVGICSVEVLRKSRGLVHRDSIVSELRDVTLPAPHSVVYTLNISCMNCIQVGSSQTFESLALSFFLLFYLHKVILFLEESTVEWDVRNGMAVCPKSHVGISRFQNAKSLLLFPPCDVWCWLIWEWQSQTVEGLPACPLPQQLCCGVLTVDFRLQIYYYYYYYYTGDSVLLRYND